jgi:hypothetical protein
MASLIRPWTLSTPDRLAVPMVFLSTTVFHMLLWRRLDPGARVVWVSMRHVGACSTSFVDARVSFSPGYDVV